MQFQVVVDFIKLHANIRELKFIFGKFHHYYTIGKLQNEISFLFIDNGRNKFRKVRQVLSIFRVFAIKESIQLT